MPGWTESIFPPYFVVGTFFSELAMVVLIALVIRRAMGLEGMIVPAHFEVMARLILASSIVLGASYAAEWFSAWWGSEPADERVVRFSFTGPYAPFYWAMLLCNVVAPQVFWVKQWRERTPALVAVLVGI